MTENVADVVKKTTTSLKESMQKATAVVGDAFTDSVKTDRVAQVLGIDEDIVKKDIALTPLGKEQDPYSKSDLRNEPTVISDNGGNRLDNPQSGKATVAGCQVERVTVDKKTTVKVKSDYLGEFEYDPEEFALGYKTLSDGSQLPILQYVGDSNGDKYARVGPFAFGTGKKDSIHIPDGLKSMDYMFTGYEGLSYMPSIPTSITSMHYAFAGCVNMKCAQDAKRIGLPPQMQGNQCGLPEGLLDMSGAFLDCKNFNATFMAVKQKGNHVVAIPAPMGQLPSSIVNITEAFSGCEKLDDVGPLMAAVTKAITGKEASNIPVYGGTVTPYLSESKAKCGLDRISGEPVKEAASTRKFLVDEKGKIDKEIEGELVVKADAKGEPAYDKDKMDVTRYQARKTLLKAIADGLVEKNAELASGGALEHSYYYDAADDKIKDDVTGLLVGDSKTPSAGSIFQRVAIDGATGLGLGAVIGKITGFKKAGMLAGVGAAIGLDMADILPHSLSPIVSWTANILPEGNAKTTLENLAAELSGSNVAEQKATLTAENVAATYQNRRLQRSIYGIEGIYELDSIKASMENNARYCGENLNFKATAERALDDGEQEATLGARSIVHESVTCMNELFDSDFTDTETKKPLLKEYYVGLMEALETYNKGAEAGIKKLELTRPQYGEVSRQGLQMLNRAYTCEVLDNLRQMDAKYHFMDDEAWTKIAGLKIIGIDVEHIKDFGSEKYGSLSNVSLAAVEKAILDAKDYEIGVAQTNRKGEAFYNTGRFFNEPGKEGVTSESVPADTKKSMSAEERIAAAEAITPDASDGNKEKEAAIDP